MRSREADNTTAAPQFTRKAKSGILSLKDFRKRKTQERTANPKESQRLTFLNLRMTESDSGVAKPSRFRVVLIREGLGNLADGYYYPAEALEEAARSQLFEGKKIYANHPSPADEALHPERTVQEILGHFENVKLQVDEQGRKMLEADVVILSGDHFNWARSLMQHAIDYSKRYPNQDFIGLSINASGAAVPISINEIKNVPPGAKPKLVEATEQGLKEVRYVQAITEAHSCDLVTSPGAGGGVIRLLEKDKAIKEGPKWEKCVKDVAKKQGSKTEPYNAYAVCTTSIGSQKEKAMDHKQEEELKKQAEAAAEKPEGEEKPKTEEGEAPAKEGEEKPADSDKGEGDDEKKEPPKKEEEAADPKDEHGDEAEDKALIAKILKDVLGKEPIDATDDEKEAVREAHALAKRAYKDDPKEAYKAAGHALKMAMHKESEMKCEESTKASDAKGSDSKTGNFPAAESDKKVKTDADKLREAEATNMKLSGEIAKLKGELSKITIQAHLDKKLKESGLDNQATKLFRAKLGEPKTTKEIDEKFDLFQEGWKGGGTPISLSLMEQERVVPRSAGSSESSEGLSLADCTKRRK